VGGGRGTPFWCLCCCSSTSVAVSILIACLDGQKLVWGLALGPLKLAFRSLVAQRLLLFHTGPATTTSTTTSATMRTAQKPLLLWLLRLLPPPLLLSLLLLLLLHLRQALPRESFFFAPFKRGTCTPSPVPLSLSPTSFSSSCSSLKSSPIRVHHCCVCW